MKCSDLKPLFMDSLYDEIAEENQKVLLKHLAECRSCQKEFDALQQTSHMLQQWEDVEPDFNVIMVAENVSWATRLKNDLVRLLPRPKRISIGFVYAAVGLFLVLAIANTQISYRQGEFKLSMGLFSKPAPQTTQDEALTKQLVEKLQQENYYLMNTLVQQSEVRQQKAIATAVLQLRQDFERKRLEDLNMVGYGLNNLEQTTSRQIQQTGRSLNELIQLINAQGK